MIHALLLQSCALSLRFLPQLRFQLKFTMISYFEFIWCHTWLIFLCCLMLQLLWFFHISSPFSFSCNYLFSLGLMIFLQNDQTHISRVRKRDGISWQDVVGLTGAPDLCEEHEMLITLNLKQFINLSSLNVRSRKEWD